MPKKCVGLCINESWFRAWRKKQTTTSFVVECEIIDKAEVIAAIIAAGGKVVK